MLETPDSETPYHSQDYFIGSKLSKGFGFGFRYHMSCPIEQKVAGRDQLAGLLLA